MSIQLILLQVPPKFLESLKTDKTLFKKTIYKALKDENAQLGNDFKKLYASQGIFSVEDFIEKNPYINNLQPELKKEAFKRVKKVFRKSAVQKLKVLDLDKSWHVIHFLLSGEIWSSDSLLGSVLMGGVEIGDESFNFGDGVPRYHDAEKVKEIAGVLPSLEDIKNKFNPEKIAAMNVYAFNLENADEEWKYLSHFYRQILNYFSDAAEKEYGILLYAV